MYKYYRNFGEYNLCKKHKILIVFYDMVADMLRNKKCNPTVTELFIRSRKLNFITQSYLAKPKNIELNYTLNFIIEISNKG